MNIGFLFTTIASMGACGVKKCHGITEQDPLAMQIPVPYMNTTIIIKKN